MWVSVNGQWRSVVGSSGWLEHRLAIDFALSWGYRLEVYAVLMVRSGWRRSTRVAVSLLPNG